MEIFKSVIVFFIGLVFTVSGLNFSVSAQSDFSMKEFDKAYITFVFDDGNMPFTSECFEILKSFDMPMCCAVVADRVDGNQELIDTLKSVENAGGEILSHTYNHKAIDSKTSTVSNIELQFGKSYRVLTKLGFKINGIIEAGNGGGEATANYEMMEPIVRKYYKYSNAYGTSAQYKKVRNWFMYYDTQKLKTLIDTTVENKQWIVLSAHSFKEISESDLKEILEYIKSIGNDKVQVVTWNYIYENFGVYTGPQIPAKEVIEEMNNEDKELTDLSSAQTTTSNETSNTYSKVSSVSETKVSSKVDSSSVDTSVFSTSSDDAIISVDDSDFAENETLKENNDRNGKKEKSKTVFIVCAVVGTVAILMVGAAIFVVIKFKG